MKWRNGLIGLELMAAVSLSAYYGVQHLRQRANGHRLTMPCLVRADCRGHRIAVRMPKFGNALLANSAVGGLLVPYAAASGRLGRAGALSALIAAGSAVLALGLRYEFVEVDDGRRKTDNDKAGIGAPDADDGRLTDEEIDRFLDWYANRLSA